MSRRSDWGRFWRSAARSKVVVEVVRHVNRVVVIAGGDAVGPGSDFDGFRRRPERPAGVDKRPNLTQALLDEGNPAGAVRLMVQMAKSLREQWARLVPGRDRP